MIKNIRVVQLWDINTAGEQIPSQHFFEVQREGSDNWVQLEIVHGLGRDYREQTTENNDIQGTA